MTAATDRIAAEASFPALPRPPRTPQRLSSEAQALAVAQALAAEFRTGAALRDRERRLPWDELERYTASGLGTISIPRAYGGLGASYRTIAEVFAAICAADPSLGQIPQNHFALIQNLLDTATEAQRQRWFADVLAGHRLGNAGPERKSRAGRVSDATARVVADDAGRLRVSGTRFYSTGALYAHWIPFRALDAQDRPVQVWVRRAAPGVQVVDNWDAFGQRTTASGGVLLDQVEVEPRDVVALYPVQDKPTLSGPLSQLIQAAIDLGIAEGALQDALAWVARGAEAPAPWQLARIGRLQVEVRAARELLQEAGQTLDTLAAEPITDDASAQASVAVARAKAATTEAALQASEWLLELAGDEAALSVHNLDRHWRNARVHTLHDPVRWKYHLLGNHLLNGRAPRRHQWN